MIKGKRTQLIESLYKGEISELIYEVYTGSTGNRHVKTYAILDDGFNTKIKIEELGIYSDALIEDLQKEGFKPNNKDESKLQLKKVA